MYETIKNIDAIKREMVRNDVIVTGIPITKNEDNLSIINESCEKIGFTCPALEINSAHRLHGKTNASAFNSRRLS